jgi:hypothetical protein
MNFPLASGALFLSGCQGLPILPFQLTLSTFEG